jgi:hypothetical protein
MGAEVGRLEPNPRGIGLHDAANALISEPLSAEPAAFGDGLDEVIVKQRARLSIGGNAMGLVLLLIVLVLLFGGGGFYLGPHTIIMAGDSVRY